MQTLVDNLHLSLSKEKLAGALTVVGLGEISPRKNEHEQVALLRFDGKGDVDSWLGVFMDESNKVQWESWLADSGYGVVDETTLDVLSVDQRNRLSRLSETNIPPIFIFHLALNSQIDLDPIIEKYSGLNYGPGMMGIASEQSGQGKTTIAIIHAARSGAATMVSAAVFAEEESVVAIDQLKNMEWDKFNARMAIEVISESRSTERASDPRSLGEILDDLWEAWSNTPAGFELIVDLPGVHKDDGVNSRFLDGIDLLRMAMPSYVVTGEKVQGMSGFDAEHHYRNITAFLSAMSKKWRLDEGRTGCLRNILSK